MHPTYGCFVQLSVAEARERFASARVARLATVSPDGRPHIIPVTFAVVDDVIVTAVDDKPKSTPRLQRLVNVEHEPRVAFLVDAYDEDWSTLWWVRADAIARVLTTGPLHERAVAWLVERHPQYADWPPTGPVIRARVTRWIGWRATP